MGIIITGENGALQWKQGNIHEGRIRSIAKEGIEDVVNVNGGLLDRVIGDAARIATSVDTLWHGGGGGGGGTGEVRVPVWVNETPYQDNQGVITATITENPLNYNYIEIEYKITSGNNNYPSAFESFKVARFLAKETNGDSLLIRCVLNDPIFYNNNAFLPSRKSITIDTDTLVLSMAIGQVLQFSDGAYSITTDDTLYIVNRILFVR